MNDLKTVLVVDDDKIITTLYRELLKNDYKVLEAEDARTAINYLKTQKVDSVLCDYNMPNCTGIEVLDFANELLIPVIMITSISSKKIVVEIMNRKPFFFFDKSESSIDVFNKIGESIEFRAKTLENLMYKKLGENSAKIIHDINNPLTIISGGLEIIRLHTKDPKVIESTLEKIDQSAKRICNLIRETKISVQNEEHNSDVLPPVDVELFLKDFKKQQKIIFQKNNVEMNIENLDNSVFLSRIDELALFRVFSNLLENSIYEFVNNKNSSRKINVTLKKGMFGQLDIHFKDNGSGIPKDVQSKLFKEKITTKPSGVGSGIGLDSCVGIMEEHFGSIKLGQCDDGAEFIITLPVVNIEGKLAS